MSNRGTRTNNPFDMNEAREYMSAQCVLMFTKAVADVPDTAWLVLLIQEDEIEAAL